jgi:hypothetical protein
VIIWLLGHCVVAAITQVQIQEGTGRRRDRSIMEDSYYEALYAALRNTHQHTVTSIALKQLKAKIVRLNSTGQWRVLLDNGEHERLAGEKLTLYHLLKMRRRQESRMIHGVQDRMGIFTYQRKTYCAHLRFSCGASMGP